jgi:ubiquinone/menaquinone biosynthesis C-methylase UbiE
VSAVYALRGAKALDSVTGVDVSASMIQCGRGLLNGVRNVELVLNEQDNLKCFGDGQFDLVCSLACLQHMPWQIAANYVREFARVCSADGWVAFQVPSRQTKSGLLTIRKKLGMVCPWPGTLLQLATWDGCVF